MSRRPRIQSIGARSATTLRPRATIPGMRVALVGVVDRADQADAQRLFERVLRPRHFRAEVAVAIEREDQVLAARVQVARGAVDGRQRDALQRAVDAAALRERIGRRVTGRDVVAGSEVLRAGAELGRDQHAHEHDDRDARR